MYLSWTLLRNSLSQTKGRLALIAGAVALGVVLLLTAASFNNALSVDTSQQWLRSISEERGSQEEGRPAPDPAVSVRIYKDAMNPVMKVEGEVITSVLVDTTDTVEAPQLFGMSWPEPGEYLVSAGLRRIMNDHPEYQLPDRFGVTDAGDLPHELTTGPDDLLVISGARDLRKVASVLPTFLRPEQNLSKLVSSLCMWDSWFYSSRLFS